MSKFYHANLKRNFKIGGRVPIYSHRIKAYEHKVPLVKKVKSLHVPCRWKGEQS